MTRIQFFALIQKCGKYAAIDGQLPPCLVLRICPNCGGLLCMNTETVDLRSNLLCPFCEKARTNCFGVIHTAN